MDNVFRWGVLGPGAIAKKFATAVAGMDDAKVVAVGSRALERAQAFATEFSVDRAYGSYEELAKDAEVDAVYVATPHPFHADDAVLCLDAGRAVLCEKPLAANASQARRIVDAARANRCFMMEAMWTRFLPAVRSARDWVASGRIGDPLRLEADFSFRSGWNPDGRLLNPALAGGGLLDVGIYVISMAYWLFGEKPVEIKSMATIGETGVDEQATLLFRYRSGAIAILTCGVRVQGRISVRLTGSDGEIEIPTPFFRAEKAILRVGGKEEVAETPHRVNGYEYEAAEVARCVRQGLLESPDMPHGESLEIMEMMDALRHEWGVSYPFEKEAK